jgi:hypothetical protein
MPPVWRWKHGVQTAMADEFTGRARLISGADQHFVVEAPSF